MLSFIRNTIVGQKQKRIKRRYRDINVVLHQEMPHGNPQGRMHGFQLWANLPARLKMTNPRYQDIPAAGEEDNDITQAHQVKTPYGFAVQKVVVKVYPAIDLALPVEEDMVAPDIPVLLAVVVQKFDGLHQLDILVQKGGEVIMEVIFMAGAGLFDDL